MTNQNDSRFCTAGRPENRLCVAVQASDVALLENRLRAAVAEGERFVELRLDALTDARSGLELIARLRSEVGDLELIATCRRIPNTGGFSGSIDEELEILADAARAGAQIVDLEIETAEVLPGAQLEAFRAQLAAAGCRLLISFHDFGGTGDLEAATARIERLRPDVVKVVSTATSLADSVRMMRLVEERASREAFVGIAMGEQGLLTRILGPRFGGLFTFAASGTGVETAPGQVTAKVLRELYGAERLTAETRLLGVAGNPISHSLSPRMQNAAMRAAGVDGVLVPLLAERAEDLFEVMRNLPLVGCAVTMPLKQQVLALADEPDPLAMHIGAANTLIRKADGTIQATNTDVDGILRPLERRLKLKGARVLLVGAGGAARAAAFGLVEAGAELEIVNRTASTAAQLAAEAGGRAVAQSELKRRSYDVLLNSTPCGMKGAAQALPVAEDELNAGVVFDMVYNPRRTPLLELAESRGLQTISGVEMFVEQGARQFELWTGQAAPRAEMERVVLQALS